MGRRWPPKASEKMSRAHKMSSQAQKMLQMRCPPICNQFLSKCREKVSHGASGGRQKRQKGGPAGLQERTFWNTYSSDYGKYKSIRVFTDKLLSDNSRVTFIKPIRYGTIWANYLQQFDPFGIWPVVFYDLCIL